MDINEQIQYTYIEWQAYKNANFACPLIINWLSSILDSLILLKIS
jgi:hypothetical protein